jgi:2-C-methyl-D-erythritol 4-phosphate cytidylyltransferase/2-C-methyl-D-erythritol 2,4-cyclodiphosphate synthase
VATPKQFLEYRGTPLFWHSVATFSRLPAIKGLVLVFPHDDTATGLALAKDLFDRRDPGLPWKAVAGGARRQDSVRHALSALPAHCARVLIHDAARPFVSPALVRRVLDALDAGAPAAVPGVPVSDTIKEVDGDKVVATPDRTRLSAVQTPQGFDAALLAAAHETALAQGWEVTDDAMLMEQSGHEVVVTQGEPGNVKITNAADLNLLESRAMMRINVTGLGYDVHAFHTPGHSQPARPMILGGVPVPGAPEVAAHSDGDVLLHAVIDALLGCACGGDIGALFPDSDPDLDNASSGAMLARVMDACRRRGVTPLHADLTLVAQVPRLAPHVARIKKNVAGLLALPEAMVNVKATTEEGLGFTGEKLGLKAMAAVTAEIPAS